MAIIKCPECEKEISDRAIACPNCGFPLSENDGKNIFWTENLTGAYDNEKNVSIGAEIAEDKTDIQYNYATNSAEAVIEQSGVNDLFLWLLSGTMVLGLCLAFFKAPTYLYYVVGILSLVFIILDKTTCQKRGIKVNLVCVVLGMLFLVPIYVIARIIKTKKYLPGIIYVMLCIFFLLFSFRGLLSHTSKELMDYINNDVPKLLQIEMKMLNSYNSVAGANYTDDYSMYNALKNTTLPTANRLVSEANSIYGKLSAKEIKEVHLLYMDLCNTYCEAFEFVVEGIEQQNTTIIYKANRTIEQATKLLIDYQDALRRLADKYGLELEW